jgi:hypothetical protein
LSFIDHARPGRAGLSFIDFADYHTYLSIAQTNHEIIRRQDLLAKCP